MTDILVPAVGESINEVTIAKWLVESGSNVEVDQPLAELETDKATVSVVAPASGMITITVTAGTTVKIGAVIGTVAPSSNKPVLPPVPVNPPIEGPVKPPSDPIKKTKDEYLTEKKEVAKPVVVTGERVKRVPMTKIRKTISKKLLEVKQQTAMLTTFNEVDMSAVMAVRAQEQESFQKRHGVKLGFMSFFVKACVAALQEFPAINARIEGEDIVYCNYFDISIAVSTEKGLMVPVIRNADKLSYAEIEKQLKGFSAGNISVDDMKGGSFTITNGGVFGSLLSTPILNEGQSGILGMHNIVKRPVVIDDEMVIRPMMYLALSYDHRIVDGKESISFLVHIKKNLEEPARLLLDL